MKNAAAALAMLLILPLAAGAQTAWGEPYDSHLTRHTIKCQGLERIYYVYVPETLKEGKPLAFMLHGYGGNADGYRPEMLESARRHGFALVIPQGWKEDGKYKAGWNVRYPKQAEMKTDDIAFVMKLLKKVRKDYGIGKENAFFSGMSNGGEMCYMMAYMHPEKWNAMASVAGLQMQWLAREHKIRGHVPFMEFHGTADKTSSWFGDPGNKGGWGKYLAVPVAVGNIVSANGCEYEETTVLPLKDESKPSRKVTLHRYLGSPYGDEVRLYEIEGGAHGWHLDDVDTTEEIFRFFEQYLR
ncbi:MAG: esterase [Bacteroidales bacterium]|nr:esterase [Bacteroidales bacterium]